jgi:ketosteroid isomerase-like protein
MRPLFHHIYWFAICLLPVLGKAQSPFSGEQNEVNKSMMAIGKAWSENNLDTLERYIDANYKHTDVRGQIQDRKTWLSYVADRKSRNVKNPGLEFEDTQIQIEGDFAFATGINIFTGDAYSPNIPNAPKAKKLRYTQVLKKENGIWKRLIFQATYIE